MALKQHLPQLLLIVFLVTATIGTTLVMQNPLSLYSRANSPKELPEESLDPGQSSALSKLNTVSDKITVGARVGTHKRSLQHGFELYFDESLWEELPTEPETHVVESFSLSLRKDVGLATFELAALDPSYTKQFVDLSSLVRQDFISLTIAGFPTAQVSREESHFGVTTSFEEYYVFANTRYYRIRIRNNPLSDTTPFTNTLLATLSFFPSGQQVQGISGGQKRSATRYETAHVAELAKPSVVGIVHIWCKRVVRNTPRFSFLKESYRLCASSKGTGLIVSEQGYIATNGHVVKTYPEKILVEDLFFPNARALLTDLVREVTMLTTGRSVGEGEVEPLLTTVQQNPNASHALVTKALELLDQGVITLADDGDLYFVQLANDPLAIDFQRVDQGNIRDAVAFSPSIKEAEVLDYDYPNRYATSVLLGGKKLSGSDVAILKMKDTSGLSFPALPLDTRGGLRTGDDLIIVGYPAIVESVASITPTVTRGIASAIKVDEGGKKLIQTDASIERGNSGGPALNTKGEVVGIVTFGVSAQLGNYNFLRDVGDVAQLMERSNVKPTDNTVFALWQAGLENFWNDYYTRSLRSFEKVESLYPLHPTVHAYVGEAKEAIEKGQDKGLLLGIEKDLAVAIAAIAGIVLLGWFGIKRLFFRCSTY